ncbi:MAG: hypothetical protein L6416_03565 [Candidatus Omnitrophica bacterium]|nr:hypothetical protein [Candidatus Omnitrophota bacterium]
MGYEIYQINREKEFENACLRCGNCCGAGVDACIHLIAQPDGKYRCDIYESRGGLQKTQTGKFFKCVPIRMILHVDWPGRWKCAYVY